MSTRESANGIGHANAELALGTLTVVDAQYGEALVEQLRSRQVVDRGHQQPLGQIAPRTKND